MRYYNDFRFSSANSEGEISGEEHCEGAWRSGGGMNKLFIIVCVISLDVMLSDDYFHSSLSFLMDVSWQC
jgi:hypothetical protein